MELKFHKMHHLGNDFIVLDNYKQNIKLSINQIQNICNRYIGIGCDQLILLEPSDKVNFYYRIYNSDGSLAVSCGNGALCLSKYIFTHGEYDILDEISLEISNGQLLQVSKLTQNSYSVVFDLPVFDDIHKTTHKLPDSDILYGKLTVGNPHCLVVLHDVATDYLYQQENKLLVMVDQIKSSNIFVDGVNVSFIVINSNSSISIRTYERGVNSFTHACGTGAVAAAYYSYAIGAVTDSSIQVNMRYGAAMINFLPDSVKLSGIPTKSFTGVIIV